VQIVVRQISGLGNQLFQLAAGRYFAKLYGAQLKIASDPRGAVSHGYVRPFLLPQFSTDLQFYKLTNFERLFLSPRAVLRPVVGALSSTCKLQVFAEEFSRRFDFLPSLPLEDRTRTLYLVGYWQSYRFADAIENELRSELVLREPAQGINLEVLNRIRQTEHPISLHMRRGDFTLEAEGNIALPISYYLQAIQFFRDRRETPTFFVFSDDIDFARRHLPGDLNFVFVDHNDASSAHEDLRLMSSCYDHIIANSTFSWWGAWLNPRPDKIVFAPKFWHLKPTSYFPELFPPHWILAEDPDRTPVAISPSSNKRDSDL
jgi:hypothetical protein